MKKYLTKIDLRIVWKWYKFLILAVLFYIIGFFLDKGILFWNKNTLHLGFDLQAVQQTLYQRAEQSDALIDKLYKQYNDFDKSKGNSIDSLFLSPITDEVSKLQMSLFLLKNDTILFWSSNTIPFSSKTMDVDTLSSIERLPNGFYQIRKKKFKEIEIVSFALIKQSYNYQNEFLSDRFYDEYDIPQSVSIELSSQALGFDIVDEQGQFMMKLMPTFASITDKPYYYTSIFFYSLGIILFIIFLATFYRFHYFTDRKSTYFLIVAIVIGLCRYVMLEWKIPANIYTLSLFKPQYYSESFWYASLGDFVLNAFSFLLLSVITWQHLALPTPKSNVKVDIYSLLILIFNALWFYYIVSLVDSLIHNSNISFQLYNILELNSLTIIGLLIIGALLASFILLLHWSLVQLSKWMNIKRFLVISAIFTGVLLLGHFLKVVYEPIATIFLIIMLFYEVAVIKYLKRYNFYVMVVTTLFIALFLTIAIQTASNEKEQEVRKVLAINLAAERDPIGELLFIELETKLLSDTVIIDMINDGYNNREVLRRYITHKYLNSYLGKYDLQVTVCVPTDSLWMDNSGTSELCYGFFYNSITQIGSQLQNSNFYFLDNLNARISYFGWLKYYEMPDSSEISVFLEFDSKLVNEETGYPELLLDSKLDKMAALKHYSYARYHQDQLINESGSYQFAYQLPAKFSSDEEFLFADEAGYEHLVYKLDDKNKVVLSKPQIHLLDLLIMFSYIFVGFYFLLTIIIFIRNVLNRTINLRFDLRRRIQFALVMVVSLSLIIIGGGTIFFNIKQYEQNHEENLREKIQSVYVELQHKLFYEKELTGKWYNPEYGSLDELLMKFANVFYLDIHLYDKYGKLIATSRPEIFKRGLQNQLMNTKAYTNLVVQKEQRYLHEEGIGRLYYQSAYIPFKNIDNETIAYLNLPYFAKQSELSQDISTFLVAILNIYVLLVLITILIAIFITNQIAQPLRMLEESIGNIQLGKRNIPIEYTKNDEIGSLVREYNRMLSELEHSAGMLAKTERELAWREMAKQIAHEIKNPLTPMKLSVQFLLRSWQNKDKKFEDLLNRVAQTLIEQINDLSAIATEFSNFANMPRPQRDVAEVNHIVDSVVRLFENSEEAKVVLSQMPTEIIHLFVDQKQIERVLINLIKNALQAIPEDREGYIDVSVRIKNKYILISVADNGTGIPEDLQEKMFRPNFTTKSSGMGLGLAIVKNIIEGEGGTISFETKIGAGTTFFIELPIFEK